MGTKWWRGPQAHVDVGLHPLSTWIPDRIGQMVMIRVMADVSKWARRGVSVPWHRLGEHAHNQYRKTAADRLSWGPMYGRPNYTPGEYRALNTWYHLNEMDWHRDLRGGQ